MTPQQRRWLRRLALLSLWAVVFYLIGYFTPRVAMPGMCLIYGSATPRTTASVRRCHAGKMRIDSRQRLYLSSLNAAHGSRHG